MRLSVITTRSGDNGTTGLGDGSRISKASLRIECMGEIDELNAHLGVLLSEPGVSPTVNACLTLVQNHLFDLGAELCIPGHQVLKKTHIDFLDEAITQFNKRLGPLQEFILPGGSRPAALAHVCRTVCRRAERHLVRLGEQESQPETSAQHEGDLCTTVTSGPKTRNTESISSNYRNRSLLKVNEDSEYRATPYLRRAVGCAEVSKGQTKTLQPFIHQYLNRLSDLLFIIARIINLDNHIQDVLWNAKATLQQEPPA